MISLFVYNPWFHSEKTPRYISIQIIIILCSLNNLWESCSRIILQAFVSYRMGKRPIYFKTYDFILPCWPSVSQTSEAALVWWAPQCTPLPEWTWTPWASTEWGAVGAVGRTCAETPATCAVSREHLHTEDTAHSQLQGTTCPSAFLPLSILRFQTKAAKSFDKSNFYLSILEKVDGYQYIPELMHRGFPPNAKREDCGLSAHLAFSFSAETTNLW